MKKLKKALKNNLLKVNLNNSYFILKHIQSNDLNLNKVQNLTRSNIDKIGLNNIVNNTVLKFPLILETFNNSNDLKKNLKNSSPVVTKFNNLVFKDNTYNLLTKSNPNTQFVKLRTSMFRVLSLVVLIKGYLKSKK